VNVAILIGHFPPGVVGGAELQAESWARHLATRHRVTVLTRRDPAWQPLEETRDGFRVLRAPVSRVPLWRTARDVLEIERTLAGLDPRPDVAICFQTFVSGLAGVRAQERLGIPAIVWLRGEDELRMGRGDRSRWIGPYVWRRARAVLVQSERVRRTLIHRLQSLNEGLAAAVDAKLGVVPNGLDLPEAPAGPGTGVLAVGRLIVDKGMDTVIEACARAGVPLTIAGDGPERTRLEALAARRGGGTRFEGMATRATLNRLYSGCACVALAARGGEGLPNVLLEAMAHGRPVVATPVMGIVDLVRNEENGLLVPADDPERLAAALVRLTTDRAFADRLAAGARATAERFAWVRVVPGLEAVIERVGSA
jgi:glycosyltransferase involved in cell wall biosynthesis